MASVQGQCDCQGIRSSKLPAPGNQGQEECLLSPSWNNLELVHKGQVNKTQLLITNAAERHVGDSKLWVKQIFIEERDQAKKDEDINVGNNFFYKME